MNFTIPLKTVNELNDHKHWRTRQRRAKAQKEVVTYYILEQLAKMGRPVADLRETFPCRVKFTRVSPGNGLDPGDGLPSAFKFVRDAVAKLIGVDDRSPNYVWEYCQQRGKRGAEAVIIEVSKLLPVGRDAGGQG